LQYRKGLLTLKLKSYEDTDDENDGMDADTGWHDEPYFLRSGV
jgi:hypothetical protein